MQAYETFGANIIEVAPAALNQELVDACQARQMKLMVYHKEKDPAAVRASLRWGVQMINCDHGDVVAQVAAGEAVATSTAGDAKPDHRLLAILLDCGDTLIDEGTEVKPDGETSVRGDLIPGAAELVHELKRRGYPLALVADGPVATFENNLGPYGLYDLFDAYAISGAGGRQQAGCGDVSHRAEPVGHSSQRTMPACSWSATTWAATSKAPTRWG